MNGLQGVIAFGSFSFIAFSAIAVPSFRLFCLNFNSAITVPIEALQYRWLRHGFLQC
jgi:hypothetical protein